MNEIERNWFSKNRIPRVPAVYAPKNYTLKAHQQRVRSFMNTHDRLLVVHGTGSGKTLSGSFIAKDYIDENPTEHIVIFVTPLAVQGQFKRSFSTVMPGARGVYFTTYQGLTTYLKKIYISRRETFKSLMKNCMIIADEAHYITEKTNISQVFYNVFKAADKVVLMTGTPIMNGEVTDLLPYAKILNPTSNIDKKNFKKNYTDYFKCKISIYLDVNVSKFPNLLPTETIPIKFTNEQARKLNAYREAKYQSLAWTGSFRRGHKPGGGWAFNRNIYSSNIFGNKNEPKHEKFLNIYRSRPYKTIVFFRQYVTLEKFKSFLNKHRLKFKEISGKTQNKSELIKNDPPNSKMIYLLTSSAKEGLDFKGVRSVIFMDYPWVPSNYNQIVGRARRYESHINLPTADRNVKVYELMYTHPNSSKKTLNTRSMNLVVNKKTKTNSIIASLKNVSIETQRCPNGPRRTRSVRTRSAGQQSPNRLRVRPNRVVSLESVIKNAKSAFATDPATGKEYHLASLNVPYNQPLIMKPVTLASMLRTRVRSAPKPKKQKTKPYSPKGGYGINVLFKKRNRRTKPFSPKRGGYGLNVLFKSNLKRRT
jgi:superfamily II DNA or RNA helicase